MAKYKIAYKKVETVTEYYELEMPDDFDGELNDVIEDYMIKNVEYMEQCEDPYIQYEEELISIINANGKELYAEEVN
ncbi:MAG: hypothetical protein R3240_00065 [Gammaproteobacteria bacterium]|nr:hypothetical protein [Gammaproteobacteria bacterium]